MADVHPVKLQYDKEGNVIAIAEYNTGDTIPTSYLNLNIALDGGAISDTFRSVLEHVDGGVFSDVYNVDAVHWDGGSINA